MVTVASAKGLVGFVIFGAVRDAAFLRTCPLPVFAAGITHRGPYKHGPGEINYPIGINGLVVAPGDVILGDDDGFLALPIADAAGIAVAARKKADFERDTPPAASDKSFIDATLRKLNCEGL
jgi:regulator of RNase E activity RraA